MTVHPCPQANEDGKPVFIAFCFSVYAWVLLEASAFSRAPTLQFHLVAALYGCVFLFLSCRRTLRFHGSVMSMVGGLTLPKRGLISSDAATAIILPTIGYTLGCVIGKGLFELWLFSAALSFIPWQRIPFCRDYFMIACMLVWIGAAAGTVNGIGTFDMVTLPLAAWNLWAAALLASVWNSGNHKINACYKR